MPKVKRIRCYKELVVPAIGGTVSSAMHQNGANAWTPQSYAGLAPTPAATGPAMPPRRGKIVGLGVMKLSGGNFGTGADVVVSITLAVGTVLEVTLTPPSAGYAAELWADLPTPPTYDAVGDTHTVNVEHTVVPTADMTMAIILVIEDDWS